MPNPSVRLILISVSFLAGIELYLTQRFLLSEKVKKILFFYDHQPTRWHVESRVPSFSGSMDVVIGKVGCAWITFLLRPPALGLDSTMSGRGRRKQCHGEFGMVVDFAYT